MASHEYFERNVDGHAWSYQQRRGFDDGYEVHGYHPPRYGKEVKNGQLEHEEYDLGFTNGAYSVLEDAYPGISEATALMHTGGKATQGEIIEWLFVPVEEKRRRDPEGYLAGYELTGKTPYG
jgi:hypothetical protein